MKNNRYLFYGQGMVEYALIMVFIVLVVVVAIKTMTPTLGNVFSQISIKLGTL